MLLQGKDGELRIYEKGAIRGSDPSGTTYWLEVLFCEMNFSGPTSRPRTAETLIMNRGQFDTDAHYVEGVDDPRYAPLPVTFSCKLADTVNTTMLMDWLTAEGVGGVTVTNTASASSVVYSWDGSSTIDGNTLASFADPNKRSYRVEVLWDGSSNDLGYRWEEVCFKHGEQSISESADGLTLSVNGQCYGDVTRITAFYSGASIAIFI